MAPSDTLEATKGLLQLSTHLKGVTLTGPSERQWQKKGVGLARCSFSLCSLRESSVSFQGNSSLGSSKATGTQLPFQPAAPSNPQLPRSTWMGQGFSALTATVHSTSSRSFQSRPPHVGICHTTRWVLHRMAPKSGCSSHWCGCWDTEPSLYKIGPSVVSTQNGAFLITPSKKTSQLYYTYWKMTAREWTR